MNIIEIISKIEQITNTITRPIKKLIINVRDEFIESVEHFVAPDVIPETGA